MHQGRWGFLNETQSFVTLHLFARGVASPRTARTNPPIACAAKTARRYAKHVVSNFTGAITQPGALCVAAIACARRLGCFLTRRRPAPGRKIGFPFGLSDIYKTRAQTSSIRASGVVRTRHAKPRRELLLNERPTVHSIVVIIAACFICPRVEHARPAACQLSHDDSVDNSQLGVYVVYGHAIYVVACARTGAKPHVRYRRCLFHRLSQRRPFYSRSKRKVAHV